MGEFIDEEQDEGFHSTTEQFADTATFIKKVWFRGASFIPSFATETGLLYPSEKRSMGIDFEHSFIFTWELKPLTIHITTGGGTEHIDEEGEEKETRGRFLYGGIIDLPLPRFEKLHLVAEYSGEKVASEHLEHQILGGLIWEGPWDVAYDAAIFWGLNNESIDLGVTTGFTIAW